LAVRAICNHAAQELGRVESTETLAETFCRPARFTNIPPKNWVEGRVWNRSGSRRPPPREAPPVAAPHDLQSYRSRVGSSREPGIAAEAAFGALHDFLTNLPGIGSIREPGIAAEAAAHPPGKLLGRAAAALFGAAVVVGPTRLPGFLVRPRPGPHGLGISGRVFASICP